jgi:hypothetical protein
MLPMPIRVALPAAAAILLVAACQESHHDCEVNGTLVGSDVEGCPDPVEDGGPPIGETDGATSDWEGHSPPERPPESDPGEPLGTLVFALHDVVLNQQGNGAWTRIGYDLDFYNTVSSESAVTHGHECVPPREHNRAPAGGWTETQPPNVPLDGEEGIDNVFGDQFFPFVESALETLSSSSHPELPFDEEGVTFESITREDQNAGRGTLLLSLQGWNGQANDRTVTAAVAYAAAGTPCANLDDVEFDEETNQLVLSSDGTTPAPAPAWDGADCFWVRSDSFIPESQPPELGQEDDLAYVADGTLVMRLRDRDVIQLFAGPVGARIIFTGAVLTARIEGIGTASPWIEDITIAGRWALHDLAQGGRHFGICPGSTEQSLMTTMLDRQADLRTNPNDPHTLDQACNAISLGLLFENGTPASLAGGDDLADSAVQGEPLPDFCN